MTNTEPSKAALEVADRILFEIIPSGSWCAKDVATVLDRFAAEAHTRGIEDCAQWHEREAAHYQETAEMVAPDGGTSRAYSPASDAHRDYAKSLRALAASPPPASYDDGVRDERARFIQITEKARKKPLGGTTEWLNAWYEAVQFFAERIEAGDAPPQQHDPEGVIYTDGKPVDENDEPEGKEHRLRLSASDIAEIERISQRPMVPIMTPLSEAPADPAAGEPTEAEIEKAQNIVASALGRCLRRPIGGSEWQAFAEDLRPARG